MLKNVGIGARLGLGFGLVILLLILVSVFARLKMGLLADLTTMMYEHPFTVSTNLNSAEADIIRMQRGIRDVLLAADGAELDRVLTAIVAAEKDAYAHLAVVRENYLGDPRDVDAVVRELDSLKPHREKVIGLIRENRREEAIALQKGEGALPIAAVEEKLAVIKEFATAKAKTFLEEAGETAATTYALIYGVVLVIVTASLLIASLTSRAITRPLNSAVAVANQIAAGDLSVALPPLDRRDEVGELIRAFATMIDNLRTMMGEIQESANVVAASVSEILVTTTEVAAGTAETATGVSQTTATVEEVKQTAQLATEKSRDVSENAQQAALVAEQGNAAVTETMDGIDHIRGLMETVAESVVRLSEQTQSIGEIITVVNDLAQQSNLLAVNAAIEASKAGEQGKGFVVVAQEIKSLADQSKQATEQVRSILGEIQKATTKSVLATEQVSKAVETGVKQAAESGESIRKLAEAIGVSAQAAAQIAASSQQQLAGMEQVAIAMENIKQAAQQNASGTGQAEQAAHTLNELGQKLKEMVGRYRV